MDWSSNVKWDIFLGDLPSGSQITLKQPSLIAQTSKSAGKIQDLHGHQEI